MKNEPKVFRSVEEATGRFGPSAVAIGNFDGVHVGHQQLIRSAVEYADRHGLVPAAVTFHPHPASVLAPQRELGFVFSLEERIRFLGEAGARHILILPFTLELSKLMAEEFVSKMLLGALGMKAVFVGENFRFGHRQGGNPDTLRRLGTELGFVSHFLPPVYVRGEMVSSSAIRRHVKAGEVARAGRLLGRCFSVRGPVVKGQGIGSKQTVPTLNVKPYASQVLPRGVFVTETCEVNTKRRWPSITNVGTRPTFGGQELVIETFLLAPFDGLTPDQIEVSFRHFLRQETTFSSAEDLKKQILVDVRRAQSYWRRAGRFKGLSFRTI